MTEHNSRPPADLLDQALEALRTARVSPGPAPPLVAATTAALQRASIEPPVRTLPRRRTLMFHLARQGASAAAAVALIAVGVFFCLDHKAVSAPAVVELDGTAYQIRGPLTHEDLAVFLLCCDRQDERDFLTLDEGLKNGVVTVTHRFRSIPSIAYKPLPPMTPIFILQRLRDLPRAGKLDLAAKLLR